MQLPLTAHSILRLLPLPANLSCYSAIICHLNPVLGALALMTGDTVAHVHAAHSICRCSRPTPRHFANPEPGRPAHNTPPYTRITLAALLYAFYFTQRHILRFLLAVFFTSSSSALHSLLHAGRTIHYQITRYNHTTVYTAVTLRAPLHKRCVAKISWTCHPQVVGVACEYRVCRNLPAETFGICMGLSLDMRGHLLSPV